MRTTTLLAAALPLIACGQTWIAQPDFPGTARDDATSFVIGTSIHVGTGMEVGWGLTADWWRFEVTTGAWSSMASLPAAPRQYCTAFTLNDKGYLFGGSDGTDLLNELWMYDPITDVWEQRASLPAAGRRACVSFSGANGKGYIATGLLADGQPTSEVWCYDPEADAWEARAPFPGPARHRACAFMTQAVMVVGGADVDDTPLSDGYRFDGFTDTWVPIAPLPEARFWCSASGGFVVGGSSSVTQEHADVWYHDFLAESWSTVEMPDLAGGPRRGGVAQGVTFLELGGLYFGLGLGEGQRHKDWWKLDLGMSVDEHTSTGLSLSPNPTDAFLRIGTNTRIRNTMYRIIDATGRDVRTGTIPSDRSIDVQDLAPGRYLITAQGPGPPAQAPFIKLP
ncbi:MAG TPA: kelch repeat-containing protein [Flavobacteriales bacterium]